MWVSGHKSNSRCKCKFSNYIISFFLIFFVWYFSSVSSILRLSSFSLISYLNSLNLLISYWSAHLFWWAWLAEVWWCFLIDYILLLFIYYITVTSIWTANLVWRRVKRVLSLLATIPSITWIWMTISTNIILSSCILVCYIYPRVLVCNIQNIICSVW
jgi:hypothetical protein